MKIYVASSWRNNFQGSIVHSLRSEGHEVYDFRNPEPGNTGFSWSEIDADWQAWGTSKYVEGLKHPIAEDGFALDFNAMKWADACVLVLPCGRSAHTEAGWMAGQGKKTVAYIPQLVEPELMYKIFDLVTENWEEVLSYLKQAE